MSNNHMTKRSINKYLKCLGLPMEVCGTRGDGYFYFIHTETGDQVGDSVYVCYLNQFTYERWAEEAEYCYNQYKNETSFHNELVDSYHD